MLARAGASNARIWTCTVLSARVSARLDARYRAKAAEYGELVKSSTSPNERRNFQQLEQRFASLADNEQ
jgi:hypothetical protein